MRHPAALLICAVALVVGLSGPLLAQAAPGGTKSGDTVTVVVHHVLAAKRAMYDSLMQKVWAPNARKAGEKYPAFGKAFAARRRYVPTAMDADSTFTYIYLYADRASVPKSPLGNDVLAAAGFSKEQLDAYRDAIRSCLAPGSGSVALVDEPYR